MDADGVWNVETPNRVARLKQEHGSIEARELLVYKGNFMDEEQQMIREPEDMIFI